MSSSVLDWEPITQGWLQTIPAGQSQELTGLYDAIFSVSNIDISPKLSTVNSGQSGLRLIRTFAPSGQIILSLQQ